MTTWSSCDAPALVVDAPRLDDEQQAVFDARGPLVRVLGAPGTGKTTTAVELVFDRVSTAVSPRTSASCSPPPGSPPPACGSG